jgi:hypothetical protein
MLTSRFVLTAGAMIGLSLAIRSTVVEAAPVLFSGSGSNPAGIQATVDAFRADLGTLNANVVGSFGNGRREINWDGVPDALSAPNALPANFFNSNSPRGVLLTTPGSSIQVSATAASGTPVRFGNLNATYTNEFQTFSAQRLFTAVGSNALDVTFFVPGTSTPALTRGFGSVFTDVDLPNVTNLNFFDANNVSLGTFFAPAGPDAGLSFLGVDFGSAVVSRVRITSGNAALGSPESGNDLVVMDDFLFGEPVPEPGSLALLASGIIGLRVVSRRRRRT